MPPRPTLRIAEIFGSFQGEGLRAGEATIFVRLAGCNLRCPFCDTKGARRGGRPMSPGRVAAAALSLQRRWPASWVDITGGEPTLQDLGPLVDGLRAAGFSVQVETNGTGNLPPAVDWVSVSPKPPRYEAIPSLRGRASEVKLVATRDLTLAVVERLRREFPSRIPVVLQAQSNAPWSRAKAARLVRAVRMGWTNVRLGLQLHRLYGFR